MVWYAALMALLGAVSCVRFSRELLQRRTGMLPPPARPWLFNLIVLFLYLWTASWTVAFIVGVAR